MNQVLRKWPNGTIATQAWLNQLGVSSKLANWHVGSGWLVRFGSRAFTQPGDQVDWQGALYALQTQLGMTVHVGGRTALELQGRSHFVPLGRQKRVILVSDQPEQLPAWFRNHRWEASLEHRCLSLFERVPDKATTRLDCGGFEVVMSSAERAIMEEMRLARSNDEVEHAYQLMEGLNILRPNVVLELLAPRLQDIGRLYEEQFKGMTREEVLFDDLVKIQRNLANTLVRALDDHEKEFLVSMKRGEPEWDRLGIEHLSQLPAIQRKLINIRNMDSAKHKAALDRLTKVLAT